MHLPTVPPACMCLSQRPFLAHPSTSHTAATHSRTPHRVHSDGALLLSCPNGTTETLSTRVLLTPAAPAQAPAKPPCAHGSRLVLDQLPLHHLRPLSVHPSRLTASTPVLQLQQHLRPAAPSPSCTCFHFGHFVTLRLPYPGGTFADHVSFSASPPQLGPSPVHHQPVLCPPDPPIASTTPAVRSRPPRLTARTPPAPPSWALRPS